MFKMPSYPYTHVATRTFEATKVPSCCLGQWFIFISNGFNLFCFFRRWCRSLTQTPHADFLSKQPPNIPNPLHSWPFLLYLQATYISVSV